MKEKRIRFPAAAILIAWCFALVLCFQPYSHSSSGSIIPSFVRYFSECNFFTTLHAIILITLSLILLVMLFQKRYSKFLGIIVFLRCGSEIVFNLLNGLSLFSLHGYLGLRFLIFKQFCLFNSLINLCFLALSWLCLFKKTEKSIKISKKLWWIPGAIEVFSILFFDHIQYFIFNLDIFSLFDYDPGEMVSCLVLPILRIITVFAFAKWLSDPYEKKEHPAWSGEYSSVEDEIIYCGMLKHIIFILLFGMIYISIWIYRITRYLNLVPDQKQRNPGLSLLCFWLVPFYSLFWFYSTSKRVEISSADRGRPCQIAALYTFLSIFFSFIPSILLQHKINSFSLIAKAKANEAIVAAANTAATPADGANNQIENLEKIRSLLDNGTITQEEFEKMKNNILNG